MIISNVDVWIVIGQNKNWKQSVEIGRRNNQNFVQIPFDKLIKQIKYKAEEKGIEVKEEEENYTSKCRFLDNEIIEHHEHHTKHFGTESSKCIT